MADSQQKWTSRAGAVSALNRWTALAGHGLATAVLLLLIVLYLVSDRHWLGAAWGIWPAWFWSPGLLVLVVLGHRRGRAKATLALLAATGIFCLVFSEGRLIHRRENPVSRHVFLEAYKALRRDPEAATTSSAQSIPLRVVSLNVNALAGGPDKTLSHLAGYEPDVCFVQEVWGGERDLPRQAVEKRLPGYGLFTEPDCVLLSRYPAKALEPIDLQRVRAQVVEIDLPASRTVTCINVHLPLLPLRLGVHKRFVRNETRMAVRERAVMMSRLAAAVRIQRAHGPVIVAGDWNVPASAGSLKPLRALLADAFVVGGSGWGNTMTNDFPVSRIDAVFLSDHFEVAHCAARRTPLSDHRLVEAELRLKAAK